MSSSSTPRLGLFKATAGTGEPFRASDVNSNWDKVDAEAVAADGRLDVIEANNWVTNARIADGAVGAAELASVLDLSGKTVSVAVPSADAHASTKKYVDDRVSSAAWVSYTPTLGAGLAAIFEVSSAFYVRVGKTVFVRGVLNCNAAPGGSLVGLTVTLPVEAKVAQASLTGSAQKTGSAFPLFATVATTSGVSRLTFNVLSTGSTYGSVTGLSSSIPSTWAPDETVSFVAVYEGV